MLTLIYGADAAARRAYLKEWLPMASNRYSAVYLLVPEQAVLESETFVSELSCPFGVEVTSFRRLANSIFRRFGGLCYHYVSAGAKQLLMWRAIAAVAPALKEYRSLSLEDMSVVGMIASTVEEMKNYGVLPADLDEAAESMTDTRLADKTHDIALIYSAYSELVSHDYDDASDDLAHAAERLGNGNFFGGALVVLDGFDGFTPQEEGLLAAILRQCEAVQATLAMTRGETRDCFGKLRDTERVLRRLANRAGLAVEEKSLSPQGERHPELSFFAAHAFGREKATFSSATESADSENRPEEPARTAEVSALSTPPSYEEGIHIFRCSGIYEEAAFVAADIARRVRQGARYREFALVARDPNAYLGILDVALENCGIPCFFSARKDATAMTAVRMILTALDICCYHWRTEDVIAYLRCGLTGLSPEECDALESYAETWHIAGRRWTDEYGWQMNPGGFSAPFDEAAARLLSDLNEKRQRVTAPLTAFFEVFENRPTVRSVSEALVYFLKALGLGQNLARRDDEDRRWFDERADAEDTAMLYACLMDALDQLVSVLGDRPVSAAEYRKLFATVIAQADLGKLPAHLDEVTVGSAMLLRKSGIRYVYLMGVIEGEFPQSESDSGCFDRREREALEEAGITLAPFGEKKSADELYAFYRSLLLADRCAILTYYTRGRDGKEKRPSFALLDTLSLFPKKEILPLSLLGKERLLYGRSDIFAYAMLHGYAPEKLADGLSDEAGFYALAALSQPLAAEKDSLTKEASDALYGDRMVLSQSRTDAFVKCPFAYHCQYSLKLKPSASGSFEAVDIGNFVHKILETFFSTVTPNIDAVTDEEAARLLDSIIERTMASFSRGALSKRLDMLAARLRKATRLLVKNMLDELRASSFVPSFFELPIGWGSDAIPPETLTWDHGKKQLSVVGQIDRVDTYRKNGKLYLRVVDYKTGKKTFSLSDIEKGLNLQMLLYLFALAADGSGQFRRRMQLPPQEDLVPAGVIYLSMNGGSPSTKTRPADENAAREVAEKNLKRTGILLSEDGIPEAMEKNCAGRYLSVSLSDDGYKSSGGLSLKTLEEFGALSERVHRILSEIAAEMSGGRAAAKPLETGDQGSCQYCPMRPVCRTDYLTPSEESEEESDE